MSSFDTPKTAAMRNFLKKEKGRVTGLSIEPDGVFIYTDSEYWQDDAGAGTWREDSETAAIKDFYSTVQPGVKNKMRRKNPVHKLLARKDLQRATRLFAKATAASRKHSNLTRNALEKYGDHGPQISGVIRDHFPQHVKDELRRLARDVTEYSNAGYEARPKGVRQSTMRELASEVARRGGSGFYGPQARRKNTVKKKTRKRNPERITQAWLDKRVSLLNDMLGRPQSQYTKTASGLTGNRGHLFIDHAYGGVKVAEMSGGGTGENNISDGYVPKKELNNFINGMIAAARLAENKKRNRNPLRKRVVRKKVARKKKDYIIFRYGQDGVSYLAINSLWVGKASKAKFITNNLEYAKRIAGDVANQYKRDKIGVAERGATSKQIIASMPGKK